MKKIETSGGDGEPLAASVPSVIASPDLSGRSNLGGTLNGGDCHAEFTPSTSLRTGLSESEILRLDKSGLRMTKAKGSQ